MPSSKGDLSSNAVIKLCSIDFYFVDDGEVVSNFTFPLTQGWAEMCQPVQRFGVPIHCLSQANSQVIASRFSILIRVASVLPFEYGDSDWRVAIKLIYRNMVQESRYNHC